MEHLLLCYQADPENRISIATRTLYSYLLPRIDKSKTRISLLDFRHEESPEEMQRKIEETKADIVGFSCYLWNFKKSFTLSSMLKKSSPEISIILGGPQMYYDEEDLDKLFRDYPAVDLVIQGEGEVSLLDYLNTEKNRRPASHSVIKGEPLGDLRDIGGPVFGDYPPFWELKEELPIELSRRCVGLCSFCVQAGKSRFVQHHKSMEQLEKELLWAKEYGVSGMNFCDAHINVNCLEVKDIVDKIVELKMDETEFHFQMMYNILKEEDVEQLGRINAFTNLGLQSTDPYVNKLCKRALNTKRFERAVSLFKKYGIKVQGHLIIGLPGDTVEGFRNSMKYAESMDIDIFDMFVFRVLPGTAFYYDRHKLGLEYDPVTYMIKKTNTMNGEDILSCIEMASEKSPDDWEMFDRKYLGIESSKLNVPIIPIEEREDIDPPEKITKQKTIPAPDKSELKKLLLKAKRIFSQMPDSEKIVYSVKYLENEWAVTCEITLDRGDVCTFALVDPDSAQSGILANESFKLLHLSNQNKRNENLSAYLRLLERKFSNKK